LRKKKIQDKRPYSDEIIGRGLEGGSTFPSEALTGGGEFTASCEWDTLKKTACASTSPAFEHIRCYDKKNSSKSNLYQKIPCRTLRKSKAAPEGEVAKKHLGAAFIAGEGKGGSN